jgi:hypothetical protein
MQMISACVVLLPQGHHFPAAEAAARGHLVSKDYFIRGLFLILILLEKLNTQCS